MADAVTTSVAQAGGRHHIAILTNISDGTGETNVVKVDISTLTKSDGTTPTKTRVKEIHWVIQGFTSVRLLWDRTTDVLIAPLSGSGYIDWSNFGGKLDSTTGDTGDILLTTNGGSSGATYCITIVLELL